MCPHCRNVHWLRCEANYFFPVRRRPHGGFHGGFCFVALCEGCSGAVIFTSAGGTALEDEFLEADLAWPSSGELHESIPEKVRSVYSEAHRVQLVSPSSFAVQIRRALEAVCEEKGYDDKRGNLAARLELLERDGHFPRLFGDVSHALRVLGNLGAHASSKELSLSDTRRIDANFRAVLDYLYVLPARLQELKRDK